MMICENVWALAGYVSSLRGETSAAAANAVYDVFMIIILQASRRLKKA